MIRSEQVVDAGAGMLHDLLTDVSAWSVWSPHVASVEVVRGDVSRVHQGWAGRVRPWFGPATTMEVTRADPGRGIDWQARALGYVLRYRNSIEPMSAERSRLVFSAELDGPGAVVVERLVAPISGLGQRRRMARLGALAGLMTTRQAVPQR